MHALISIQLSFQGAPPGVLSLRSSLLSLCPPRGLSLCWFPQTPSSVTSSQWQCQALPGVHLTVPCSGNFLQVRHCSVLPDIRCLYFVSQFEHFVVSRRRVNQIFVRASWMEAEVEFTLEMKLYRPTCIQLFFFPAGSAPEGKLTLPLQRTPLQHVNYLRLKSIKTQLTQE